MIYKVPHNYIKLKFHSSLQSLSKSLLISENSGKGIVAFFSVSVVFGQGYIYLAHIRNYIISTCCANWGYDYMSHRDFPDDRYH